MNEPTRTVKIEVRLFVENSDFTRFELDFDGEQIAGRFEGFQPIVESETTLPPAFVVELIQSVL